MGWMWRGTSRAEGTLESNWFKSLIVQRRLRTRDGKGLTHGSHSRPLAEPERESVCRLQISR